MTQAAVGKAYDEVRIKRLLTCQVTEFWCKGVYLYTLTDTEQLWQCTKRYIAGIRTTMPEQVNA